MRMMLAAMLVLGAGAARAADVTVAASPHARAELVADAASVAPGVPFRIGLRLTLAPGWHTYFANPGDAGAPAELALDLPAGPVAWPAPRAIAEGTLVVFGYRGTVLLAREVTPPAALSAGDSFRIGLDAAWLVCGHVCIPEEARLALTLPVGAAVPSPAAGQFARAGVPAPAPFAARARFTDEAGTLRIDGATAAAAVFIPRLPFVLAAAATHPVVADAGGLTLALTRGPAPLPAVLQGVLLLTDAAGAVAAYDLAAPVE
jgi:thiol:disulfide interchange protein DsbD